MGQKVNPKSFRLAWKKDWISRWFSGKNQSVYLVADLKIRRFIENKLAKSTGIGRIEIERQRDNLKIIIYSTKPGMIIGRSGTGILDLKNRLIKEVPNLPQQTNIDILEIKTPDLNAKIVALNIANQIEKRISYRRAVKQAIEKVMQAKAKGVKVRVAGRLGGAEIARVAVFKEGKIPLATLKAHIDFAAVDAKTTWGVIGVKVWICKEAEEEEEK